MSERNRIIEQADKLIRRFGTRDPFVIAEGLGIILQYSDQLGRLKGLYRVILRNRFMILNQNNEPITARIVCAHELGHDQLHRDFASRQCLSEIMLYDMSLQPEYEANLFAAELLLEDETFLEYAKQGFDASQIAHAMETDVNLVALKADCLRQRGYDLHVIPHRSDFLKG